MSSTIEHIRSASRREHNSDPIHDDGAAPVALADPRDQSTTAREEADTLELPEQEHGEEHPPAPAAAAPQAPEGKRPFYKKPLVLVLGGLIVLAGVAYGIHYYLHAMAYESTDDAFIDAHTVQVSPRVAGHVLKVFVKDNERVEAGQQLLQLDPTDFQSRVAEAQAALDAAIAQRDAAETNVKLIEVTSSATTTGAQSAVAEAESGVQTARASVDVAQSKVAQAQADIASAQANAAQARADATAAEADVTRANTELERLTGLAANAVSQQEIINAKATAQVAAAKLTAAQTRITAAEAQITQAKAALNTAKEGVAQAQSQQKGAEAQLQQAKAQFAGANISPQRIAVAKSDYANASAQVARLQAQLALAQQNEKYTIVYAPVAGRVTRKSVEPGRYLDVGQTVMALVPRDMWVTANFKETQLDDIRPGQPAEITIDAYPDLKLHGHVDSIQRGAGAAFSLLPPENATGNYVKVVQRVPVKIVFDELPDTNHPIGPGMSVAPEVKVK